MLPYSIAEQDFVFQRMWIFTLPSLRHDALSLEAISPKLIRVDRKAFLEAAQNKSFCPFSYSCSHKASKGHEAPSIVQFNCQY